MTASAQTTTAGMPRGDRFGRASHRLPLALQLLLAGVCLAASIAGALPAPPIVAADDGPSLIFHQQTQVPPHRTSPRFVATHMESIEALPFDGITVDIPASLTLMRGEPIPYSAIYDDELALLENRFTRMRHNFVMVYIDDPGDVFDDQAWAITIENWRTLARAVRDAGLQGIVLDNEAYQERWLDFPEDYENPTHSLEEYQNQTRTRGRQIMEAMVAEFPEIELLVFHGPYVSEPATPRHVRRNQTGPATEHELLGPFFIGFMEGAGPQASVIDGGEVYQYRTASDFRRSYAWRKWNIASETTASAIIPPELRLVWPSKISVGFGVHTLPYADEPMDPAILRSTLRNALDTTDEYVWLYTEEHTWTAPGGMPSVWEEAIRDAASSVRHPLRPAVSAPACDVSPRHRGDAAAKRRGPDRDRRKAN